MTARSSNAYMLSVLLHAAVIVIALLLGYVASQNTTETPKVFELVQGVGNNYAATEAPALGVSSPTIKAPASPPTPPAEPQPQPAPVQTAPTPPKPAPAPTPTPTVPNFTKSVTRIENRTESHIIAKYKAEQKKKETYEKFLKDQAQKKQVKSPTSTSKAPQVDAEGIAEGVVGGSTANKVGGAGGKALSREEQDELGTYFAMLKQRLRDNFSPPPDASDRLATRIEFFVAANGSISRVRILHSSGNPAFDQAVLDAFKQTQMPPRPDRKGDIKELNFKAKDDDAG